MCYAKPSVSKMIGYEAFKLPYVALIKFYNIPNGSQVDYWRHCFIIIIHQKY